MAQLPGGPQKVGEIQDILMPDAVYLFRIARAEIKVGKPDPKNPQVEKHPYINLMLRCQTEGEWFGRTVWDIITLKPSAKFKLRQLLEDGLGWSEEDELADTDQLVNEEVEAAVTTEKGQQGYADKNKIVRYMKVGASAAAEIAPAD